MKGNTRRQPIISPTLIFKSSSTSQFTAPMVLMDRLMSDFKASGTEEAEIQTIIITKENLRVRRHFLHNVQDAISCRFI
jgi:hypothetical protein